MEEQPKIGDLVFGKHFLAEYEPDDDKDKFPWAVYRKVDIVTRKQGRDLNPIFWAATQTRAQEMITRFDEYVDGDPKVLSALLDKETQK